MVKSVILFCVCFLLVTSLQAKTIQKPIPKMPYHPEWVTVLKKGKLFKYKRKEFSSPSILGEKLFVGVDSGAFYALKKKNGRKLWRYQGVHPINSGSVVLETKEGGRVFTGDDEGLLHAFNTETGQELWHADLGSEITSAPTVNLSRIFVSTLEGKLFALSVEDGKIIWEKEHSPLGSGGSEMTIRGTSAPAFDESAGRLYVGFSDGTLMAYSTEGKLIWEKSLTSKKGFQDIDGTPLMEADADRLFVSTYRRGVYAISKKNGALIWSFGNSEDDNHFGSGVRMLLVDDTLYVSGSNGHLQALNKKDGSKRWDIKLGTAALTAPVYYKETLAVGLSNSTINFIRMRDGRLLAKRFAKKGISSDPLVDEDRIYYLSNGGRVYSLKFTH